MNIELNICSIMASVYLNLLPNNASHGHGQGLSAKHNVGKSVSVRAAVFECWRQCLHYDIMTIFVPGSLLSTLQRRWAAPDLGSAGRTAEGQPPASRTLVCSVQWVVQGEVEICGMTYSDYNWVSAGHLTGPLAVQCGVLGAGYRGRLHECHSMVFYFVNNAPIAFIV